MGILIDTSILVDAERAGGVIPVSPSEPAAVAAVTVAELLHGARRADTEDRRAARESFVESVISWMPVIDFDLMVARRYASLWAATASAGTPVGVHDLMVAATAQLLGWRIWTIDFSDFHRIPGIALVEPDPPNRE